MTYSASGDSADTAKSLTTKIKAVTPTQTQLNAMTVEQLQIFASLIELTYDYTNKTDLIALILAEYTE